MKIPTQLKAGTLVYALVISLLISMLLGGLIMVYEYGKVYNDRLYYRELARDNLHSGINQVLYGGGPVFGNFGGNLFSSETDSFKVESRIWGLYGVMHGVGVHGSERVAGTLLFGPRPEDEFAANLFLKDRSRPLTLAGTTVLKGTLYVPKAGIERGFVGRKPYQGAQMYWGEKLLSTGKNPQIELGDLGETQRLLRQIADNTFIANGGMPEGDSLHVSFGSPTLEIGEKGTLRIDNTRLKGNIIIQAGEIYIGPTAQLENVLLFASKIEIASGFTGTIQAFVTDTLIVGAGVSLGYPSALVVAHPLNEGYLVLGQGSRIEGTILNDGRLIDPAGFAPKSGYTLIETGAEVYGNVWVPFNLDIKGKVSGNVITDNFLLKTPAAIYENYLVDATITHEGLSERYAAGFFAPNPFTYLIINWLE